MYWLPGIVGLIVMLVVSAVMFSSSAAVGISWSSFGVFTATGSEGSLGLWLPSPGTRLITSYSTPGVRSSNISGPPSSDVLLSFAQSSSLGFVPFDTTIY